ncbi:hypothetical protein [Marispirochaeta aestuarii]|uniref:hypothetical protein n=1 Tax=Marispirochaeta aestuarii TaxID=1963862 RepID=UPI0029C960CB|nr:hypothetical protein [Marispirochaeta aestuarii]
MSTTPSTTENKTRVPYTVLGGDREREGNPDLPLTVLLLNRGTRVYRSEVLQEIERLRPAEIISLEGSRNTYDLEPLARKFPRVRFIRLHRQVSLGEYLNIGMDEARGTYVLVIWNEMRISQVTPRALERVAEQPGVCTVPVLLNQRNETIPTMMAPGFHRKRLKVLPFISRSDGMLSLFPYDHCGLYRRSQFNLLGGFDPEIENPYWQLLDFGFRAYLWGERISSSNQFRIVMTSDPPTQDTTPDAGYRRFFLKNLAIRFDKDRGVLPRSRFLPFYLRSGATFVEALREFREAAAWVGLHQYRFVQDARTIADLWEVPET